jgi:hypothetical protein
LTIIFPDDALHDGKPPIPKNEKKKGKIGGGGGGGGQLTVQGGSLLSLLHDFAVQL